MVEQIKIEDAEAEKSTKVWAVAEFCRRYRLDDDEEKRLVQLFGEFAAAHELMNNASRVNRSRS